MLFKHAIVWIDHSEAHLMSFSAEESQENLIKAHSKHHNIHHKAGTIGSGHEAESQGYYHEVARALEGVREIVVVGPGSAKMFFTKHLHKHDPATAAKVVGIETVDHPSDKQLLAYARHYFVAADRMRGDAGMGMAR